MNKNRIFASAMIFAVMSTAVFAHDGATGVVKKRMEAMSVLGKTMQSLAKMMQEDQTLDAELVKNHARIIIEHSGSAMMKLFPDQSNDTPSVARPEIWTNWKDFNALADRLNIFAKGLEHAAENGRMVSESNTKRSMMGKGAMMGGSSKMPTTEMLASMPVDGVFNMLAQTCSACHTQFRLEKNRP